MCDSAILPSILVNSREEFEQRLEIIKGLSDEVHFDILDGSMFKTSSWFDTKAIAEIGGKFNFEIHLMVENPLQIIETCTGAKNIHRAIVHAELDRPVGVILEWIKDKFKLKAGIALNPETPIEEVRAHLDEIDQLTIMGVHPGASGREMERGIIEKIKTIRKLYPNLCVEIDGAVKEDNITELAQIGANRFVIGSGIFESEKPKEALNSLLDKLGI
ncbi:MAG: hypothetical protein ACD_76C00069G0002 [uncultured bacterium]|nr:MAG: hypothetical protein ACD_76C00069G0002 [uncultured bacterium]HBD05120.1 hypothetical protein [Candidatus Uhrbacteria bacterium]